MDNISKSMNTKKYDSSDYRVLRGKRADKIVARAERMERKGFTRLNDPVAQDDPRHPPMVMVLKRDRKREAAPVVAEVVSRPAKVDPSMFRVLWHWFTAETDLPEWHKSLREVMDAGFVPLHEGFKDDDNPANIKPFRQVFKRS